MWKGYINPSTGDECLYMEEEIHFVIILILSWLTDESTESFSHLWRYDRCSILAANLVNQVHALYACVHFSLFGMFPTGQNFD